MDTASPAVSFLFSGGNMSQVNRKDLLKVLSKVKPAVAIKDYVPILNCFMFDGDSVTGYNDLQAITKPCDIGITGCIPADLLIKTLNSFNGESVDFSREAESGVLISVGKSEVNLPSLPVSDFPEVNTKTKVLGKFFVTDEMLYGISKCLLAVGNDANHAEQMGITLDPFYSESQAALYSTDNATISRYTFESDMELPDDAPLILPTVFCQQLLALTGGTLPEISIYRGALVASFGNEGELFSKTLVDEEPMHFAEVVDKFVDKTRLTMHELPVGFSECIERALLIQEKEVSKTTFITVEEKKLRISSESKSSKANDVLDYDGGDVSFSIDPTLVKRVMGSVDKVAMLRRVLVFTGKDENYLHLISHIQE